MQLWSVRLPVKRELLLRRDARLGEGERRGVRERGRDRDLSQYPPKTREALVVFCEIPSLSLWRHSWTDLVSAKTSVQTWAETNTMDVPHEADRSNWSHRRSKFCLYKALRHSLNKQTTLSFLVSGTFSTFCRLITWDCLDSATCLYMFTRGDV